MKPTALKAVQPTIDMEAPILDMDGKPIPKGDGEAVLRDICINALLAPGKDEAGGGDAKDKLDRFLLAMLIRKRRRPKLTSDEVTLLKKQIATIYPPLIMGRAWALLDPAAVVERENEGD
jgi:hypothetical protein